MSQLLGPPIKYLRGLSPPKVYGHSDVCVPHPVIDFARRCLPAAAPPAPICYSSWHPCFEVNAQGMAILHEAAR